MKKAPKTVQKCRENEVILNPCFMTYTFKPPATIFQIRLFISLPQCTSPSVRARICVCFSVCEEGSSWSIHGVRSFGLLLSGLLRVLVPRCGAVFLVFAGAGQRRRRPPPFQLRNFRYDLRAPTPTLLLRVRHTARRRRRRWRWRSRLRRRRRL